MNKLLIMTALIAATLATGTMKASAGDDMDKGMAAVAIYNKECEPVSDSLKRVFNNYNNLRKEQVLLEGGKFYTMLEFGN